MSIQKDFVEEKTLLQHYREKLGVVVDWTPKCHPEMAGEGIEHAWACFKLHCRRLPLSQKRGKEKFRNSVRQSFCPHTVLTLDRCRKFAKRARRHVVNYDILDNELNVPTK